MGVQSMQAVGLGLGTATREGVKEGAGSGQERCGGCI